MLSDVLPPTSALPRAQHATWQLGAPTISMFYGLRLVASILLSKALLGATLITDAVQVRVCKGGGCGSRSQDGLQSGSSTPACSCDGWQGIPCPLNLRMHPLPPFSRQIVGAIVTVAAVTIYLAFQWRDSRRAAARAAADKAAEAGCAVEENGAGTAVLPTKAGTGLRSPPAEGPSSTAQEESHAGSLLRL